MVTARSRAVTPFPVSSALFLWGALAGPGSIASAAVTCVSNAASLQAALDAAEVNGEDDEIRIRQGVYLSPVGGFSYISSEDQDLALRGGYELIGIDCVQTGGAEATVLDGEGARPVLFLEEAGSGSVVDFTVEKLTLRNGSDASSPGNGLSIWNAAVANIGTFVHHCILTGNFSPSGGAFQVYAGGGAIRFENNLVAGNNATGGGAGFLDSTAPGPGAGVTLVHNTIAGNDDVNGYGGVIVRAPVALLADNILSGNDGFDLLLLDAATNDYVLERNDLGEVSGAFTTTLGNLTDPAGFVGGGDYRLRVVSPLRDAGTQSVATIAATDVAGRPRLFGSEVDIGAYESLELFLDSFEDGDSLAWSATVPPP